MSRPPIHVLALAALATQGLGCADGDSDRVQPKKDTFTVNLELGWAETGYAPLEGATVAVDNAWGRRVEKVSGADGTASFRVDWAHDGPLDVTVDAGVPGVALYTIQGIERDEGDLDLQLRDDSVLDGRVRLWGVVDGLPPSWGLNVSAFGAQGTVWQSGMYLYELDALPDMDLELIAVTFHGSSDVTGWYQDLDRWTRVEVPALKGETNVNFALSDWIIPYTFDVGVFLDADDGDPLLGPNVQAYVMVVGLIDGQIANACGYPTSITRNDTGSHYNLSGEYVVPNPVDSLATEVWLFEPDFERFSYALVPGTPEDWLLDPILLGSSTLVAWSGGEAGWWGTVDRLPVDYARVASAVRDADDNILWLAEGIPGETHIRLPTPPSSVNAEALAKDAATMEFFTLTGDAMGFNRQSRVGAFDF